MRHIPLHHVLFEYDGDFFMFLQLCEEFFQLREPTEVPTHGSVSRGCPTMRGMVVTPEHYTVSKKLVVRLSVRLS